MRNTRQQDFRWPCRREGNFNREPGPALEPPAEYQADAPSREVAELCRPRGVPVRIGRHWLTGDLKGTWMPFPHPAFGLAGTVHLAGLQDLRGHVYLMPVVGMLI